VTEHIQTLADTLENSLRRRGCYSAEYAVSRRSLCMSFGCPDRSLRKAKETLINRGVPVVAAKAGGYYIATGVADYWSAYHQCTTRIRALAREAQVFAKQAKDIESMQLILGLLPEEEGSDG